MTATGVIRQHIEIVEGAGGPKPRIVGSRIRVEDVVIWHERLGMSPDEILQEFPTITLADIYAALAFYWDNREFIDQRIRDSEALAEELRRRDPGPLRKKLDQMRRD